MEWSFWKSKCQKLKAGKKLARWHSRKIWNEVMKKLWKRGESARSYLKTQIFGRHS